MLQEKKKILIVDDDLDLLDQQKLLLELKGYQVVTAESAEEGWQVYKEEKPDVAVIDLMMEEHDSGFILSFRIKKTEHGKKIPVIMLTSATYVTGYKFEAKTEEEREWIKCDEILNKPIQVDQLAEKIEHYLAEKAIHQ